MSAPEQRVGVHGGVQVNFRIRRLISDHAPRSSGGWWLTGSGTAGLDTGGQPQRAHAQWWLYRQRDWQAQGWAQCRAQGGALVSRRRLVDRCQTQHAVCKASLSTTSLRAVGLGWQQAAHFFGHGGAGARGHHRQLNAPSHCRVGVVARHVGPAQQLDVLFGKQRLGRNRSQGCGQQASIQRYTGLTCSGTLENTHTGFFHRRPVGEPAAPTHGALRLSRCRFTVSSDRLSRVPSTTHQEVCLAR